MESLALQRRLLMVLCAVLFLLNINNSTVQAQDLDDVTISGRVTDTNGAALPNATVTATLVTEKQERTVTTNDEGRFRIIELKPGIYTVRVEVSGFAILERTNLTTISGQNVQLNLELSPADVLAQTVVVDDSSTPAVDTTRTIVGGTVSQIEIEELPNVNRSPLDLVFTLGGVAEEPLTTRDIAEDRQSAGVNQPSTPIGTGVFSLSGGAAYSNNLTIDGLDNNDDRDAQERFQPSIDAIAEVQVITNQFSSEYGRASGGRVNIRTRGGTNKFRGRAYLFYRNSDFNANTYNNNRRNLEKLPFVDYNPGFTFSGPIPIGYFKNKTFFFSSYEYDKFLNSTRIDTVLPTVQNPLLPLPMPTGMTARNEMVPGTGQIAPYINTIQTPSTRNTFTQRIDHNFTDKHSLTLNYQLGRRSNFRQFIESTRIIDDVLQGTVRNTDGFYFTDNYVLSSKIVNQFKFQFSKLEPEFGSENPLAAVALITVRDPATVENRSGTLTAGNSTANFASTREETRYQFQETLSAVVGAHSLKFGADAQSIKSINNSLDDATGTFNYNTVSDFTQNRVLRYRRNFGLSSAVKNTYFGAFIQDEWRARPNLTVSLGLRFENEILVSDGNNFGPRVGIAYAPFKDGKGVIRVGGGIFYNRVLLRTIDDYSRTASQAFDSRNVPGPASDVECVANDTNQSPRCVFLRSIAYNNAPTLDQLRASTIPGVSAAVRSSTSTTFLRRLDDNLKVPESYQFNVGFERDIGNGFVFETNFTFNRTIRLFREFNVNAPRLPSNTPDIDGVGGVTFTDFLLGINTGTTRFELGSPTDAVGTRSAAVNGQTVTIVNLRTINNSSAAAAPITLALNAIRPLRPNPLQTQIEQVASIGDSNYRGLVIELRRRFRKLGYGFGASFRGVYTLSSSKDDGFVDTSSAQISGDFDTEDSRSLQDRRHRFAVSGTFDTPKYIGRLRFSPILRLGSVAPFNISIGGFDRSLDDVNNDRPNFTGDLSSLRSRQPGDQFNEALLQQISLAPIGSPGNLGRNAGLGTRQFVFDLNVSREIRFNDRFRLRPNAEFDNILNSKVLAFSSDFINFNNTNDPTFRSNFLVPQRALRPRQIRFGLRFDF